MHIHRQKSFIDPHYLVLWHGLFAVCVFLSRNLTLSLVVFARASYEAFVVSYDKVLQNVQ